VGCSSVGTSLDDSDLTGGLLGRLWVATGGAAPVCDRVDEVVASIAHHEAAVLEAAVVDEDRSQPAVTDEHECVCGFVEPGVAASGCGGVNGCGAEPG
jgi:hypothetical protein